MKTLNNQTLFYDADCPLCQVYTSGFVKLGMLDNKGRKEYGKMSSNEKLVVDTNRAVNEIALLDRNTDTVIYGVDSLLKIMEFRYPLIGKIGRTKPVNFLLKRLYAFISFNRKVVIPSKTNPKSSQECKPTFNYTYRFLYLVLGILIASSALANSLNILNWTSNHTLGLALIIVTGQLIFQAIFTYQLGKETTLNYLGNLMTIALLGCLLFIPIIMLNHFISIDYYVNLSYFLMIGLILFFEHRRRVNMLNLPQYLPYLWVGYLALLITIFL